MKHLGLILIVLSAFTLVHSQTHSGEQDPKGPIIKIEPIIFQFDTVEEGTVVEAKFTVYNKGDQPLILNNVKSSCGCLTPAWDKEPIAPGDSNVITGRLSTQARPGMCVKSMTISSNSEIGRFQTVYIKGFITPKRD